MKKFGNRNAVARQRKSMTQEELAEKIDVSRAALSHYEKNRREQSYDTLARLQRSWNYLLIMFLA